MTLTPHSPQTSQPELSHSLAPTHPSEFTSSLPCTPHLTLSQIPPESSAALSPSAFQHTLSPVHSSSQLPHPTFSPCPPPPGLHSGVLSLVHTLAHSCVLSLSLCCPVLPLFPGLLFLGRHFHPPPPTAPGLSFLDSETVHLVQGCPTQDPVLWAPWPGLWGFGASLGALGTWSPCSLSQELSVPSPALALAGMCVCGGVGGGQGVDLPPACISSGACQTPVFGSPERDVGPGVSGQRWGRCWLDRLPPTQIQASGLGLPGSQFGQ